MNKVRWKVGTLVIAASLICTMTPVIGQAQKPFAGVTITLSSMVNSNLRAVCSFIPDFEKLTGMKVHVDFMPYEVQIDRVAMDFAAGGGYYDVIHVDGPLMGMWTEPGHLYPLDEFIMEADRENVALDDIPPLNLYYLGVYDFGPDGKRHIMGLPSVGNYGVLAYRKDLFGDPKYKAEFRAKYGYELKPPETWKQYRDMAKFFTRDTDGDGKIDLWGIANRLGIANTVLADGLTVLWAYGGDFIDENMRVRLADPKSIEAEQFYLDLYVKDKVHPPGAMGFTHEEIQSAMMEGKIAMLATETWAVPFLVDPLVSTYALQTAITIVPGYEYEPGKIRHGVFLGGAHISMSSYSKQKKAAWALIEYLTGKRMAKRICERSRGAVADRWSVMRDPELRAKYPWLEWIEKAVHSSRVRPRDPLWTEVEFISGSALQNYLKLNGEVPLKILLEGMRDKVEKMYEEAGYYREGRRIVPPDEITNKIVPELLRKFGY